MKRREGAYWLAAVAAGLLVVGFDAHAVVESAMKRTRDNYFLISGYPSQEVLNELMGEDCTAEGAKCPPLNGLLGELKKVTDGLKALWESEGKKTCADIPTSGTATLVDGEDSYPVTYETAKLTIPSGLSGGGTAFDRRIVLSVGRSSYPGKAAFEASCTKKVAAFEYKGKERFRDNLRDAVRTVKLFIDAESNLKAEMYMTVVDAATP